MEPKNGFRVIIVGGGVAGLSLALMLEKNGIDFVILEAYHEIAPQVGASFGILPNGLRVLDQLGCYDRLLEMAEYPVDRVVFRDSGGNESWSFEGFHEELVRHHGYPILFLDRQMVMKILYDKIQHKAHVLTNERVVSVQNHASTAAVVTTAGRTFEGDIVIGADGIHSIVRQQMWQEAGKAEPTWIDPTEEQALPASYACIFGISEGVKGIAKGTLTAVSNDNFSYLVPSGPGNKTYWFLVRRLGQTVHGNDIPRFTKEDEEALAKEHWDDQITPTVRFSDLYEHKIASVYTSLPEYVYKRWYFQRILTIGDACHKFEPITGQGGNAAIETAASLVNHLVAALQDTCGRRLSTEGTSELFEKVQRQRENRVWDLVRAAHARQRLDCMETPVLKFVTRYLIPHLPKSSVTESWITTYSPAVSLNMLPQPLRNNAVPFYDELFQVPKPRGLVFGGCLCAAYLAMAAMAFRMLLSTGEENGTWALVREVITKRSFFDASTSLRQTYTGLRAIDLKLQTLVAVFFPAITGSSGTEVQLQFLYLLSTVLPLMAVITVEGFRPRNNWTLLSLPSLWGVLYQLRGIGFIFPLYCLISILVSRNESHLLSVTTMLPLHTSKAIMPALVAGYIIPTILLFLPIEDHNTRQGFVAFWQPAPVLVSLLTMLFSKIIRLSQSQAEKPNRIGTKPRDTDIHDLQSIYKVTGVIAASFHITVILGSLLSRDLTLAGIFLPRDSFAPIGTLGNGAFIFFQNDLLFVALASLSWVWVNMWDLRRVGLSNLSPLTAAAAIVVLCMTVGPGATVSCAWYWREQALSGALLKRQKQNKEDDISH